MNIDKSLAQLIDYTSLRADLKRADVFQLCQDAIKYKFKAVCIPPYFTSFAKSLLEDTQTSLCTVIGFPMGYCNLNAKMEEMKKALEQGCDEIDFVVNISAVKNNDWNIIDMEFDRLTTIAHMKSNVLKAIFETSLLTNQEIEQLCNKVIKHNVDFAKTSTGFSNSGADLSIVKTMKEVLGEKAKIKASGGIKTREQAIQFIEAGAKRIGTSSGIQIVT